MKNLEGYRTIVTAALTMAVGILGMLGVDLPGDFVNEASGGIIAVMGAVFGALRAITDGPVAWKR